MSLKITHRFFQKHPLTKHDILAAWWRFGKWQIRSRINKGYFEYPFIENSRLWVKNGMTGATGNIYAGLHEFEDMAFLLHCIRQEDLFLDVGANIGSYTVLASAVARAQSFCFEPVPATFKILEKNIEINSIGNLVTAFNNGVGNKQEKLSFTDTADTVNHVVLDTATEDSVVVIDVVILDQIIPDNSQAMIMKLDVEGFEKHALEGAERLLHNHFLKAIIVELNGCCHRYGVKEEEIHELLLSYGFLAYDYDPFKRTFKAISNFHNEGNTLYIRDIDWVQDRVTQSRKFKAVGKEF